MLPVITFCRMYSLSYSTTYQFIRIIKYLVSILLWNAFLLQNRELQIMRKLEHINIVKLRYFFYSSGEKVSFYTF